MNNRTERLQAIDRRPEIDNTPRVITNPDPSRGRPRSGPLLLHTLRREVRRCEERLERARDDLRRYLLSHDSDESPGSVGRTH